jgi:hypothetical protein
MEDRTNPRDAADTKRLLAGVFGVDTPEDAEPEDATAEDAVTLKPAPAPPVAGVPTRRMQAPPPERTL